MNISYAQTVEIIEIIEQIKEMKDKTLDHFYEDSEKAKKLLINLNKLENDANKLIEDFKSSF